MTKPPTTTTRDEVRSFREQAGHTGIPASVWVNMRAACWVSVTDTRWEQAYGRWLATQQSEDWAG